MWNRMMLVALVILGAGGVGWAQEPAQSKPLVGVKVQVVVARYQGEKKISSLPYMLGAVVNGSKTSLRMSVQVPIAETYTTETKEGETTKPKSGYSYRPVVTNIDCQADSAADGYYRLMMTVAESSVQLEAGDMGKAMAPNVPMFRNFNSSFQVLLRDGQTIQYTSATDPVTGEVTKIDVTLNVLK